MISAERIARALSRIEAASSRIEAAVPVSAAADPALAQKYAELRGEASRALADIDQLIESLQP